MTQDVTTEDLFKSLNVYEPMILVMVPYGQSIAFVGDAAQRSWDEVAVTGKYIT